MSKKRRHQQRPKLSESPGVARPEGVVAPGPGGLDVRLSKNRWWWRVNRLVLAVVGPLVLLVAAEGMLRLLGCGWPTTFFVPYGDGQTLMPNRRFTWRFMRPGSSPQPYPLLMPARKPAGTLRVFVVGESAAQGTPAPAFGFARILEVLLQQQYPDRRFEVLNVAMRGINSHLVRSIAQDCARYEPDLFVVYMGNNEAIGVYAPEPEGFNLSAHLGLLRAAVWVRGTRVVQGIESLGRALLKPGARREQDMAYFRQHRLRADDPRREGIYRNFQANLRDICRAATAVGAKVLLCTVPVNLADFPPLASLHRAGLTQAQLQDWEAAFARGTNAEAEGRLAEALAHYRAALVLDDHYAELHFRMGRCHRALDQFERAYIAFVQARDWDALQFRTDSRLNAIIRSVAASHAGRGVELVDVEAAFVRAAQPEGGIPGQRFFYEHVHLTFDGDYLLATTVLPAVARALGLPAPGQTQPLLTRAECAEALGFSLWDELGVHAAMVRSTARPPFLDQLDHAQRQSRAEAQIQHWRKQFDQLNGFDRSVALYQAAVARRPNDWQIRFNYGNLLSDFGDRAGAVAQYSRAVELMPVFPPLRMALAQALWDTGQRQQAIHQLHEALRWDPDYVPAKQALAQTAGLR
jgi:tetratricopeptide (TPR) repeat protein